MDLHAWKIARLQEKVKALSFAKKPLSLKSHHYSNTTRAKTYHRKTHPISFSALNTILHIDPDAKTAWVEPQVSMDQLVKSTLLFGLMPKVVPEFKGITVGGAIMGGAAESSSHRYGIFHDTCQEAELILGSGEKVVASNDHFQQFFHGISSSYGSLAYLGSAKIGLITAPKSVSLSYLPFNDPLLALEAVTQKIGTVDFLDAIIYSPTCALVIIGMRDEEIVKKRVFPQWFAQKASLIASKGIPVKEKIPLYDYLFRYDEGAFWMGSFLFNFPFMTRYFFQGILNWGEKENCFSQTTLDKLKIRYPGPILRALAKPFSSSQSLWSLLHKAREWIENRLMIQDCCIPMNQASEFFHFLLKHIPIFPLWICPLKGTYSSQIFAPHQNHDAFINFGLYGALPSPISMHDYLKMLEKQTHELNGRKVLYSTSAYSLEEFWHIYPKEAYTYLRQEMFSENVFYEITDKVLTM